MEIFHHAGLSQKRWGGQVHDYLEIHRLIDSTKVLCSDNRHRIFHTHWAVKEVVIPIFGEVFTNQDGRSVDVKALCEKDHLLVDYHHRFIPTLADFVNAMEDIPMSGLAKRLEKFHAEFVKDSEFSSCLLSPLAVTGKLKSLLITHNSWFINHILPKLGDAKPLWVDFDIAPALFFDAMRFELWMDNGFEVPTSAEHLVNIQASYSAKSH
ncbi:MAG: hypothetical protein ISR72_02290 [Methylobacter sp.]|nr:hypothetical protein [Methylobacter sp.]